MGTDDLVCAQTTQAQAARGDISSLSINREQFSSVLNSPKIKRRHKTALYQISAHYEIFDR